MDVYVHIDEGEGGGEGGGARFMAVLSSDVSSVYGVVMDRGSLVDFLEGLFAYFWSCGGGLWCWSVVWVGGGG